MNHIINFKEYKPNNFKFGENVIYLISDDGQDWYECQKKYKDNTLKVEYSANGTIVRASRDVSRLCPYNASVIYAINLKRRVLKSGNYLSTGW